jgi:hypothetical protein
MKAEEGVEKENGDLWGDLGLKPFGRSLDDVTESELQLARKDVRGKRERIDQDLFRHIEATCSSASSTQGNDKDNNKDYGETEVNLEQLFHLDYSHLEPALGPNFKNLLKEYRAVCSDIEASREKIKSVERVADWWTNFESCSRYKQNAEYSKAVEALEKLQLSDGDGLETLPERETFVKEFSLLTCSLTEEVGENVRSLVQIKRRSSENEDENGAIVATINRSNQRGHIMLPSDLWNACKTLNTLKSELDHMTKCLEERVFSAILGDVKNFKLCLVDESSAEWTLIDGSNGNNYSQEDSLGISTLQDYTRLMKFVWNSVFGRSAHCRQAAMNAMWYPLKEAMQSIWLGTITKESIYSTRSYPDLVSALVSMESELEYEKLLSAEDKILSRCAQQHFDALSSEIQRTYLGRARSLIVEKYGKPGIESENLVVGEWESNEIIAETLAAQQYSNAHGPLRIEKLRIDDLPVVEFGTLLISSVSAELVSILNKIMEDAGNCCNVILTEKLIQLIPQIGVLWVHLPATLLRQELESVAHTVMMYFNDTMYLVGSITRLMCDWHDLVNECNMMSELAAHVEHLREEAYSRAYAQVRGRTLELQSLISASKFFRNTHKPSQEKKVRNAMIEIRTQIERLAGIWKSVLPPEYFAKFLGAILDSLCTYTYAEIMSMKDISVKETEALPTLLLELVGGDLAPFLGRMSPGQPPEQAADPGSRALFESLFRSFVPCWIKLQELVGLFSMSLQDIVDKWLDRHFQSKGFTSDEIVHFISIVFEDSDLRSEKISIVMRNS